MLEDSRRATESGNAGQKCAEHERRDSREGSIDAFKLAVYVRLDQRAAIIWGRNLCQRATRIS